VDRGVVVAVALSTGELVNHRPWLSQGEAERLRRLEASRERQRRGSRRRERTCRAIAQLRAREARRRKEFLHRLSHDLARNHGLVAIEDLPIKEMTRAAGGSVEWPGRNVRAKAGLNREIPGQGWGELDRQLAYKTTRAGGTLVKVPAAFTSQRCNAYGVVAPLSRTTQTTFRCVACGHCDHADVNAAKNILAAGLGRDSAQSPLRRHGDEARTTCPELARVA
jgi:transposase